MAIGAVVQISDGAVQTSGVAVSVIPFGGTEAAGTGTVAYSTNGVVLYTPVQAETDYTSFVLIASKAGCIPASTTVVTSASATAGVAVLDSSTQTQIDKLEAVVAGTVTGAGTSTEVFVGPSATVTITVDASGNRSNVSVT